VRLQIDTKNAAPSIRIGFTDQRLTAHGGLIVWSHVLRQKKFRQQLRAVLPHDPTSPNAYDPTEVALGVEGIASQSTLSRFFRGVHPAEWWGLGRLAFPCGRQSAHVA
jgi:hypothetical protein